MTRTPRSYRLPDRTLKQLMALSEEWGESQTEVIVTAVDRLYQKEIEDDK